MTYAETIDYLYSSTPVFQHSGASAYKPGLGTSLTLDRLLDYPHTAYRTIHIAGTNGKGSVSHLLAAVLQEAGYKVGLYTSPHLVDFRERIRVNGQKISEQYVVDFVDRWRDRFEPLHPSFFELTSTMAFDYFRKEHVDYAVIETGLGGRLDSTNIITPILSVITNISFDHMQFLGNTLPVIAAEKAGIIKPGVPVVTGDMDDRDVFDVFVRKAIAERSPFYPSTDEYPQTSIRQENGQWMCGTADYGIVISELRGAVQRHNMATVLTALRVLKKQGVRIPAEAVREGFARVTTLTGLMGRWQVVGEKPTTICDTGHNTGGWIHLSAQLQETQKKHPTLRMIIGMVNDKDINGVLTLMPANAVYYFTQASIARALPAEELAAAATAHGLKGKTYLSVADAVQAARKDAAPDDFLFIGGSTFIVADFFAITNR